MLSFIQKVLAGLLPTSDNVPQHIRDSDIKESKHERAGKEAEFRLKEATDDKGILDIQKLHDSKYK